MTAIRYSGLVTARITYVGAKCGYNVYLSTPTTPNRKGKSWFFHERSIPGGYPIAAVDAVETFDQVSRIAFARVAWSDLNDYAENSAAFQHASAWTSRPSFYQVAFVPGSRAELCPSDGIEHTDIVVHRSKQALGAYLMTQNASQHP